MWNSIVDGFQIVLDRNIISYAPPSLANSFPMFPNKP